jgi:hypothetical protein
MATGQGDALMHQTMPLVKMTSCSAIGPHMLLIKVRTIGWRYFEIQKFKTIN